MPAPPYGIRVWAALFSIATIGDERATDFLADIARSHRDEDLRSTAVFYLGTMGTERSRAALIRVLLGE
jgi:HEAT repeat protein